MALSSGGAVWRRREIGSGSIDSSGSSGDAIEGRVSGKKAISPGGELLKALLVVRVVCVDVGESDTGDAETSGLVETLDARSDLDTGLGGSADGAGGEAEEGHYDVSGDV